MLWKRIDPREKAEHRFKGALHVAVGMLGWLLPDTDAVENGARLEDEDVNGELSEDLRYPLAVLDGDRLNLAQEPESCWDASEVTVERSSPTLLAENFINAE